MTILTLEIGTYICLFIRQRGSLAQIVPIPPSSSDHNGLFNLLHSTHIKLLNEYLHEKKCVSYRPLQTQCARRMFARLADKPEDWMKHIERFTAEIIVKITYGKDIIDNDPHLKLCDDALISLTSCGSMGSTPVDFLPFLKHCPSWFPGTYYINLARTVRSAIKKMYDYPFEAVRRRMIDGTARPSYVAHHLNQLSEGNSDEEHLEDLKGSACQLFAAGAETNRKGTVVIYNAYAILRDESLYTDPDTFNPSLYLPNPEGNGDPRPVGQFGFGRRICSGQYLAEASLFISIASILATFYIGRAKDEKGNEIVPELELMTGVTSHPKPFPCAISPRDKASESLINQAQIWD